MLNQAAKDAAEEAKAQGKGFFARVAQTALSGQRVCQKCWQMAPEALLAETPEHYTVAHGDIVSVRMHYGAWDELHNQYHRDEMHIKTHRERTKLTFEYRNAPDARHRLKGLLGKTVR